MCKGGCLGVFCLPEIILELSLLGRILRALWICVFVTILNTAVFCFLSLTKN